MLDDATLAARLYPSMAPANAAPADAAPADAPKDTAAKLYGGPPKYVSPFGPTGQIGRSGGDYPAEQPQQPAAPKQPQPQQQPEAPKQQPAATSEPVTAETLGLEADHPLAGEAAKTLGELGIDRAGADKLQALQAQHAEQAWATLSDGWEKAARAEFADDDLAAARQAVAVHGDDELLSLLNHYRIGNHPAVIRFARNVARAGKQ